jgi:co-chaperonin GroES (HSP10)
MTIQNMPLLPWQPVRDFCFVRELPVEQKGVIIPGIDLNRSADHSPVLYGIVEAVGLKVTDVVVGDRVAFEIGTGEFRIPGDDMVRIMYERDIAWVVTTDECDGCPVPPVQCPGLETIDSHCVVREVTCGK